MTRRTAHLATVIMLALLLPGTIPQALGSTPSSDTVSPASPSASWTGPARTANTAGPSDAQCTAPDDGLPGGFCDDFSLTVDVPATYWDSQTGGVRVDLTGVPPAEDFDLYIYDSSGAEVANSALPASAESALIPCASQAGSPYKVRAVYYTTVDEGAGLPGYQASATLNSQAGSCAGEPVGGPATFVNDALGFAPATITSAQFLGAEPQVTIERRASYTQPSAGINPNRIFVDWPVSSRSGIGQLNRSLDGGDSFRLLFDPTCANRSRPNCLTSGGGDTENEVNLATGHLYFADQEVLANEALATSFDHGDSFVVQTAVSNGTTGTDRQWIAATDNTVELAAGRPIYGFLVYHVAPQHYIQAIDATGLPVAQPVAQLRNVGQSGQLRVDNNASSPGHGWIYQPHNGFSPGGTFVATGPSNGYALPEKWEDNQVSGGAASSFPWIAIDAAGNAYATWDNGGVVYYSFSAIRDKSNDPTQGGRPGTTWSPKVRVSLPEVGSAVFPEVTAGDAGRIAVTYVGTTNWTGEPDDAPNGALWHTYAAVIPDALAPQPTVNTGKVTHRAMHVGNICTSGTTCAVPTDPGDPTTAKDRSLLDMIDISFDEAGRLGIITMDNNSDGFHAAPGSSEDEGPFTHFVKQTSGISVLANKTINVSIPTGARSDPAGDATWPNTAAGTNLASLDALNTSIALENGQVVVRLTLADAKAATMARNLTTYNGALCAPATACLADRFQYVVRFMSPNEIFHLSAEFTPGAPLRFFGGKLDANDKLVGATSPTAVFAAAYHTDSGIAATGSVSGQVLTIRAPMSAFGLVSGTPLYSVTGFTMVGPSEATEITIDRIMRTVDATPPFDATLADTADLALTKTDAPDPVKVNGTLTYTLVVRNNGPLAATGVTLTDQLPKGAGFGSATTTQGSCAKPSKSSITCSLGTIASGSSVTVTITIKPTGPGILTNSATVSATSPRDPNTANNTATATTTVIN
ncbi:MAG TPA: DUF11 domain-containing protein [Candidatus Limnocylindria bacterium]|nr:DUF11 domain-containing protein [Candidatus Limnocylindria bacterium]